MDASMTSVRADWRPVFPWTREVVVGSVEDGLGGRKYDLEDCLGRKLGGLEIDVDLALLMLGLNRSRSNRNSTHGEFDVAYLT